MSLKDSHISQTFTLIFLSRHSVILYQLKNINDIMKLFKIADEIQNSTSGFIFCVGFCVRKYTNVFRSVFK